MLIVFVKEESIFFHLGSRVEPRFRRLGRGRLVDQAEELRVVLRTAGAQRAVSSRALRGARYVILNQMITCPACHTGVACFRRLGLRNHSPPSVQTGRPKSIFSHFLKTSS